jgi:hypothetical protein
MPATLLLQACSTPLLTSPIKFAHLVRFLQSLPVFLHTSSCGACRTTEPPPVSCCNTISGTAPGVLQSILSFDTELLFFPGTCTTREKYRRLKSTFLSHSNAAHAQ